MQPEQINAAVANSIGILFAPAGSTVLETYPNGTQSGATTATSQAAPGIDSDNAGAGLRWHIDSVWVCLSGIIILAWLL